ncbi:hypothetical protein [Eubacterium sp. 14-2]|uniref:hypothetical protein n=1 Tax=Eubacterium sp. 14-2 TaxID=1235790 RepID=UPI0003B603FC|nr:hypothetical protein [Eubacterium sp. 14-2]
MGGVLKAKEEGPTKLGGVLKAKEEWPNKVGRSPEGDKGREKEFFSPINKKEQD